MHRSRTARRIGLISAARLSTSAAMIGSAPSASAANGAELESNMGYKGPVGDELCVQNVDGSAEQFAKLETDPVGQKQANIQRKTTENQQKVLIKGTNLTAVADMTSPKSSSIGCQTEDQQTLTCTAFGN